MVKILAVPFCWLEDDISTLLKATSKYDIVVVEVVGDAHKELYYVPAVVVFIVDPPPPLSEKNNNLRNQFYAHQQFSAHFRY